MASRDEALIGSDSEFLPHPAAAIHFKKPVAGPVALQTVEERESLLLAPYAMKSVVADVSQ